MAGRRPPVIGRRPRVPPAEARAQVLDAATECFERYGIAQTTIDDVVRAAQIPRATLYRIVGNKNQLLRAVVEREMERLLERLAKRMARHDNVATALVDAATFTVDETRKNRMLELVLAPESFPSVGPALMGARELLADHLTTFIGPFLELGQRSGDLRPEIDARHGAEFLLRLIGSLTVMPEIWPRRSAERRRFLELVLVPVFVPDSARAT